MSLSFACRLLLYVGVQEQLGRASIIVSPLSCFLVQQSRAPESWYCKASNSVACWVMAGSVDEDSLDKLSLSSTKTSEAGRLVGKGMIYDMQVRKEELAERLSKIRKPLPLAFPLPVIYSTVFQKIYIVFQNRRDINISYRKKASHRHLDNQGKLSSAYPLIKKKSQIYHKPPLAPSPPIIPKHLFPALSRPPSAQR